jgi:hypothetical protein
VLEETQDEQEIIARVAALDIGKAELVCCVRVPDPKGGSRRVQEVTTYSTMTRSLQVMADLSVVKSFGPTVFMNFGPGGTSCGSHLGGAGFVHCCRSPRGGAEGVDGHWWIRVVADGGDHWHGLGPCEHAPWVLTASPHDNRSCIGHDTAVAATDRTHHVSPHTDEASEAILDEAVASLGPLRGLDWFGDAAITVHLLASLQRQIQNRLPDAPRTARPQSGPSL